MAEFEYPTYYLDLTDRGTRNRIVSAKVGETIRVSVRSAEIPDAAPLMATGIRTTLSDFVVKIQTADGIQTHNREWEELAIDLAAAE
jgi:hypothetical protein